MNCYLMKMIHFMHQVYEGISITWCIVFIVVSTIIVLSEIKKRFKFSNSTITFVDFEITANHQEDKEPEVHSVNSSNQTLTLTEEENYVNDNIYKQFKTNVMINHIKYLRDLHIASERCYVKSNAVKCIEIITYCPHLINVKYGIDGKTPFHRVCSHKHRYLMSFMLSKGADPWMKTNSDETSLSLVIQAYIKHPNAPSFACLELLQKHGCYLADSNKWYKLYLEAAMLTNNKKLVDWLFKQASKSTDNVRWMSLPLPDVSKP